MSFTQRDTEYLAGLMQCLKEPPKVDYDKFSDGTATDVASGEVEPTTPTAGTKRKAAGANGSAGKKGKKAKVQETAVPEDAKPGASSDADTTPEPMVKEEGAVGSED
ncbi:hypothetical protein M8818_007126 [Zalaria obscura]|uniref:Uncharacterized protein n=1 Tax=Zalaria obscura TaxID=2024903 RepID=A0ACC3S425_9PEZI